MLQQTRGCTASRGAIDTVQPATGGAVPAAAAGARETRSTERGRVGLQLGLVGGWEDWRWGEVRTWWLQGILLIALQPLYPVNFPSYAQCIVAGNYHCSHHGRCSVVWQYLHSDPCQDVGIWHY